MLVADTLRSRRAAVIAWTVGGVVFMCGVTLAYVAELEGYPGGAAAMGGGLQAAAQAMRLLRWPAERLDTFGGYITYHNLTILALALSLWAGVQGVRTLRGADAELSMEQILATGRSRRAVLGDRVIGFLAVLAVITVGIGLGLAASTAIAGELDVGRSLVAVSSTGLCALAAYGLGVLVGQIAGTARAGSGLVSLIITGFYLFTNVWEEMGAAGGLRFLSPFYYSNQSRVLVPGHSVSLSAVLVLLAGAAIVIALAGWVFEHRDVPSPLWSRRSRPSSTVTDAGRHVRSYWAAETRRGRGGLLAWAAAMAVTAGLLAWMEPAAVDLWKNLGVTWTAITRGTGFTPADQYMAFAAELVLPIVAGYVIAQAAGWVAEMRDGRVELMLGHPVTWRRLIGERLVVSTSGVLAVAISGAVGMIVGAAAVGVDVRLDGLARLVLDAALLAAALGGVAALLVAWLRKGSALIVLSVVLSASYLLLFLVPLFDWPNWVTNLSVFGAFGRPYLEIPPVMGLSFLGGVAFVGYWAAVVVADRLAKAA